MGQVKLLIDKLPYCNLLVPGQVLTFAISTPLILSKISFGNNHQGDKQFVSILQWQLRFIEKLIHIDHIGMQWLSGKVLD